MTGNVGYYVRSIAVSRVLMLLVLAVGCTQGDDQEDKYLDLDMIAPVAVYRSSWPVAIGDASVSGVLGSTVLVEIPVRLVVGSEAREFAVRASTNPGGTVAQPTIMLSPGETQYVTVSVRMNGVLSSPSSNYISVSLEPIVLDPFYRGTAGIITVDVISPSEARAPIVNGEVVPLAGGIDVDVLENDRSPAGEIDVASLRIVDVDSSQIGPADVTVDGGFIRVTVGDRPSDGVIITYEVCSTNGACATSTLTGYVARR